MASPASAGDGQSSSDDTDDDADDDDISSSGNTASTEPSCYTCGCSEQAVRHALKSHSGLADYPMYSSYLCVDAPSVFI